MAACQDGYDRKIVLVTGGLGFIGSSLVRRLAECGPAEIRVVDSLDPACGGSSENLDVIAGSVRVEVFDLRDSARLRKALSDVHVIFNLAGRVSHIDSMTDPLRDLRANAEAHLSLLEACREVCPAARIVYAGTRQCYGRPQSLPVCEDHPIAPVDVNGVDKYAAESYHQVYHRVYGLETCVLRLTNTYGPRQFTRHSRLGFIGWFFHQLLCGQEIVIFGNGEQLRDLTYVDCVVDAFLTAGIHPRAPGRVFNLGSGAPISLLNLVRMMIEVFGRGSYRLADFPEERRRIDIGSYYSDFSRIRRELGWNPRIGIREGLKRTFDFYRHHPCSI